MTLIPKEALESHIGVLGKTGSGKSNLAKVLAEKLMHAGERVCALDPTGTWWGLRLAADGKKPSLFQPVIFGGAHGDLALAEHHGAVLGEAIGTSADSAIIDTQQMKVGERTRFATDFAEALLRANRGPLHLIVDEAHLFAPQGKVNDPQSGKMVGAFNNLVSLGRGRGLRIILISQRPAKLHKDSLTQIETLIAMRLIAPQDRAAVKAWVGEWADPAKGDEIIASLPSLPRGDAWVWSPQIGYLERQHFPLAVTYDSGTAEANAAARELPPIDTAKLGDKMDAIRQEAQANDPKRLKARIAELERAKPETIIDLKAIGDAEARGYANGVDVGFKSGMEAGIATERKRLGQKVLSFAADFALATAEVAQVSETPKSLTEVKPKPVSTPAPKVHIAGKPAPVVAHANGFTGPQIKILQALAMWQVLGHDAPTKPMVAMVAGYSHSSGGFANLLSQLKTAGAIEYPQPGRIGLLTNVGDMGADEGRFMLLGKLSGPQRKLFDALIPGPMTKAELGEATGYSHTSGGFANLLSQLRTLGLINYPAPGRVELEGWVSEIA